MPLYGRPGISSDSHEFIVRGRNQDSFHPCKMGKSGGSLPDFLALYVVLRDIDKVDELMADITEQQEVAQQISDAISRPMGFDVDEVIGAAGQGILEKA